MLGSPTRKANGFYRILGGEVGPPPPYPPKAEIFKELGFKTVTGLGKGFEACCYYGGAGEILSDILFLSFKIKSKNYSRLLNINLIRNASKE